MKKFIILLTKKVFSAIQKVYSAFKKKLRKKENPQQKYKQILKVKTTILLKFINNKRKIN